MAAYTQDAIMLFGDSMTELGWERPGLPQLLSAAYVRKFDVVNRGLGGYQTNWAIEVFQEIFARADQQEGVPKVQLLIIWFGANDAAPAPSPQHVPLAQYRANLINLVNMVKSEESPYYSADTRVILITPPPVNTYQWTTDVRDLEQTRLYAQTVREVGENLRNSGVIVHVADAWAAIWNAAGQNEQGCEDFLHDGLHLNAAGYKIVFRLIMRIIRERYPEIYPQNLQTVFIPWPHDARQDPCSSRVRRPAIRV